MIPNPKEVDDAFNVLSRLVNIDVNGLIDKSDLKTDEEKSKAKSVFNKPQFKDLIKKGASESELKEYIKSII